MLKHLKNPKNWKKGGLTYLRGSPRFKQITQLLISVYSWILCFLESALKDLQSSDKIMFKYLIKKGGKKYLQWASSESSWSPQLRFPSHSRCLAMQNELLAHRKWEDSSQSPIAFTSVQTARNPRPPATLSAVVNLLLTNFLLDCIIRRH